MTSYCENNGSSHLHNYKPLKGLLVAKGGSASCLVSSKPIRNRAKASFEESSNSGDPKVSRVSQ